MTQLASGPVPVPTAVQARRAAARRQRKSTLAIGLSRGVFEIKALWRSKAQLAVTIAMPFLFMVVLNAVFNSGQAAKQQLVTALVAVVVMSTALQGIALSVGTERSKGGLLRLRSMPMTPAAYFIGKIIMVLATTLVQITVVLAVGRAVYHVQLPTSAEKWAIFAWVYVLGVVCCTLLGLAVSNFVNSENGGTIVIMPFVALQLISGVFIQFTNLSPAIQKVAAVFPLKWMVQGMHAAFLSDDFVKYTPAHAWELGRVALVLGAWTVGALVLCLRTFRWRDAARG